MAVVIDASVALKWVLEEEGSDRALKLAASESLIAPQFLLLECANVLTTKVRTSKITAEGAAASLTSLASGRLRFQSDDAHVQAAHAIAVALRRSAYDSLYLALALDRGVPLVTADARFAAAAQGSLAYRDRVRVL